MGGLAAVQVPVICVAVLMMLFSPSLWGRDLYILTKIVKNNCFKLLKKGKKTYVYLHEEVN